MARATRRSPRPRSRFRFVGWAILGLFGAGIALACLALPFRGAPGAAETAKAELQAAASALRAGDTAAADQHVSAARVAVDDVQGRVQGIGGDVWSWVPVAGGSIRDVRRLGNALEELTAVAETGAEVYPSVMGKKATLFKDGSIDMPTFTRLADEMAQVSDRLTRARNELESVGDSRLLLGGRLAAARDEALTQVEPLQEGAAAVDPLVKVLPRVFGAEGERKYLVAMLNPSEQRYSGGAPLTLAPVTFDNGKMTLGEAIDTSETSNFYEPIYWRKVKGNIFHRGKQRISAANYAPTWPVSGQEMLNAWRAKRGRNGAGLIVVDVVALARLLEFTGPIDVPTYGTLTSDNLVQQLVGSYDTYQDNEARHRLNMSLIPVFTDRLLGDGHLFDKFSALRELAQARHFAVYFRDDQVQEVMSGLGITGDFSDTDNDFIGVFNQNINEAKTDYWQRRTVRSEVVLKEDGSAHVTLTTEIHNDTPPYAQTQFADAKGQDTFTRWNGMSLAAFLPKGVTGVRPSVDGKEIVDPIVGDYFGRPFTRTKITFAPQEQHTFVVEYDVPKAAVASDDALIYRLDVVPQGLVIPQQMEVSVTWPRGYHIDAVPKGWKKRAGTATWTDTALVTTPTWEIRASRK